MILTGLARIGKDAELRYTASNEPVANLSLAFNYGRKGDEPAAWLQWGIAATPGLDDIWRAVARDHGLRVQRRPPRPSDAQRRESVRAQARRGVKPPESR